MTCHYFESRGIKTIICTNDWGRLHMGNRYVWVDFHEYCGPTFFTDSAMTKLYEPKNQRDPIWPLFETWRKKNEARKQRQRSKRGAA